jgi:hypothetical protein
MKSRLPAAPEKESVQSGRPFVMITDENDCRLLQLTKVYTRSAKVWS